MANFVTDTFTDTNGTGIPSHTGELGATWTLAAGANYAFIDTNRVYSNTSDAIYIASGTPPGAEYSITASFRQMSVVTGQQMTLIGRWTDGNNRYTLYINADGTIGLYGRAAGVWSSALGTGVYATGGFTLNTDYTIRLEIKDATKKVFLNGTEIISTTDNSVTAAGQVGFEFAVAGSSTTGLALNDFAAGPNPVASPTAGTVSPVVTSTTTTTVSGTACTGGTANFSYQYQRAPDVSGSPGTYANVGSAFGGVAAGVAPGSLNDTGLTPGNTYWYRYIVTDSGAQTSTSAGVSVTMTVRSPATYYVSAAGNNSNSGTSSGSPWLTIAKVNTFGLVPGDTVLFNGGDTFAGNLLVNPAAQPTALLPIVVSSYGTGQAIINPSTTYGIKILDAGYVTVKNITIAGPGVTVSGSYPSKTATTTSTTPGLIIESSSAGTYRSGIVIDNVTVSGCYNGIEARNSNASATVGFDGLQISNCTVHDCGFEGIAVWGIDPNVTSVTAVLINRYVRIQDCNVYDIRGLSSISFGSGFGILLFNSADSVVDRCRTKNIAEACNNTAANGPTGILMSYCTRCVIRRCEVALVWGPSLIDGCAFDLDFGCNNCVIEYCFARDSVGAGIFLCQSTLGTHTGSIIRYNIVQNCGTINSSNGGAAFSTSGNVGSPLVHNNTFYNLKPAGGIAALLNSNRPCSYYNNIFAVEGSGAVFGTAGASSPLMAGNVYNVRTGASFSINPGSTYTSFAALQGAGYEVSNGVNVGSSGDPLFLSTGSGGDMLPTRPVSSLSAYNLGTGSAARGVGISLLRLSLTPSHVDFHGRDAIAGENSILSGLDAGAVRFGSVAYGEGLNGASILGML